MFGFMAARPQQPAADVITVNITGCSAKAGGVGIDLNHENMILEVKKYRFT